MKIDKPEESKEMQKESSAVSYYEAVGRRKESSARVRLYVVKETSVSVGGQVMEKGAMVVNGRPVEQYFPGEVYKKMYQEPFRTTNTVSRFAISVKTSGGGLAGQLGAVIHGISRALEKVDKEKFRPILKKRGFMKRDPRAKQRRKAGFAGKARARKQSPKR
ncbi:MAG: 30S ribosomal protein S9 [Candidatus Gottesmanbacteria bacterium GW2011_GWA2_47_9]|uniref:30S ribosomal protein S9 n=3 Tax=Candidatus Gottesmaniibacteriota TaxID=1752720 RepID=A0A0G1UNK2_9BACT|nr:MAG: 30S ribosomal protein S9 [Candidatus Gottesmanbacteria bacterium GW2011_GWA2_47_9]KKU95817.1 MAG: 30S ribosomal protein S9 [Candidatus Gottesmanbacteria bacterium GW2011_GWA1_48_13]